MLALLQTGKTLIILLLQKQSDLGLHCLFRSFLQAISVQNFRTSIVIVAWAGSEGKYL